MIAAVILLSVSLLLIALNHLALTFSWVWVFSWITLLHCSTHIRCVALDIVIWRSHVACYSQLAIVSDLDGWWVCPEYRLRIY
jgi:hypothetical protein